MDCKQMKVNFDILHYTGIIITVNQRSVKSLDFNGTAVALAWCLCPCAILTVRVKPLCALCVCSPHKVVRWVCCR